MTTAPYETFASLSAIRGLRHGFIQRVPNLSLAVEREQALRLLDTSHREAIVKMSLGDKTFITAEQIHNTNIVRVNAQTASLIPQCDGLLTNDPRLALGIYTADCGAIYLVDPDHQAIGLLHSGKKGTELGILTNAIEAMICEFGTDPSQLIVQLAPCIRPPHYEIDFAADIAAQAKAAGVDQYYDCGQCTAANPEKYYSYRRELGKTGRHLAVLGYGS